MFLMPRPTQDSPPPLRKYPKICRFGLGLAIASSIAMVFNQLMCVFQHTMPINLLFFVFAFLYLNGAFLAVGTYGYKKGTKLFTVLMICRLATALSVVIAVTSIVWK